MKKVRLFFCIISMILFATTSCSDETDGPDPDIIWDFVNYSIEFTVDNNLLLNDEEFLSNIVITYNGKEFTYSKENDFQTRATYCYPIAIRSYNNSHDKEKANTVLGFGEFRPNDNHKGQKFTIDWGNGRVDEVGFDIFITWKKGKPTIHKKLRLNGEERNFAPLHLSL